MDRRSSIDRKKGRSRAEARNRLVESPPTYLRARRVRVPRRPIVRVETPMPEISRFSRRFTPPGLNGTRFAGDPEAGDVTVPRPQDTDAQEATMPRPETVADRSDAPTPDRGRHVGLDFGSRGPRSHRAENPRSHRAEVVQRLFDAHHHRVLAFLRRLTSSERAEDLAQEVFFRLFSVKNLESREITVSYLFRIGENLVRKAYHREVRHRRAGEELRHRAGAGVEQGTEVGSSLPEGLSSDMTFVSSATLRQALATLTDNEQAAIRLIVCRGLSYEQAACSLGVNVSTINNWKHRGVKKLKRIIEEARLPRGSEGETRSSSGRADSGRDPRRIHGREGSDPSPHRGRRLAHRRVVELETGRPSGGLVRRAG